MAMNLRSEQSEKVGPAPNAYFDYETKVEIPLGVVQNWAPKVLVRPTIGPGQGVEIGTLESIKIIRFFPENFKIGTDILGPTMTGTTYAEKKPGSVKDKISTCSPEVEGQKGEILKFGLWNAQYSSDYDLRIDGSFDRLGRSHNVKGLRVTIKVVSNEVKLLAGNKTEVKCLPYLGRIPIAQVSPANNITFSVKDSIGKDISYAILQTVKEDSTTLNYDPNQPKNVLIWNGSKGKNILDIKEWFRTSLVESKVTILNSTQVNAEIELLDPPGKPLPAFFKSTCTTNKGEVYNIINFDNPTPPLLNFNTYLMMRSGKPQLDYTVSEDWDPKEGTNWIPISMVNWNVSISPFCINPPCKQCSQKDGDSGWSLDREKSYTTENEVIKDFPLPEWVDNIPNYQKDQPIDPGAIFNRRVDSGFYICLKDSQYEFEAEYLTDLDYGSDLVQLL